MNDSLFHTRPGRVTLLSIGILFAICSAIPVFAQTATPDAFLFQPRPAGQLAPVPNGPVRQVASEEEIIRGSSASIQGERGQIEVKRYDSDRLVEKTLYRSARDVLAQEAFRYDRYGRLTEVIRTDADGHVEWRYEYVYSRSGQLIREVTYGVSNLIEQVLVYEYENGRLGESVRYGRSNNVEWRRVYTYDDEGYVWDAFTADGLRIKQVQHRYDDQGRLVREEHRDQYETLYEVIEYAYGTGAEPIEVIRRGVDEVVKQRDTYRYDRFRNVVFHQTLRPESGTGTRVVTAYTYDHHNNWIEQSSRYFAIEDVTTRITREKRVEREITYGTGETAPR
ncbi:MAG: hypothetical protein PF508_19585 [Spirochaeta sp.]|jgi:YD repeat-containing protein|nr:hypothetical protein [Spirochaeta sp.]